jgi:hypothetical protein
LATEVKLIARKGSAATVEISEADGSKNRLIFPEFELLEEDGKFFIEKPEEGAQYGESWEDIIHTKVGPKGIAALLRKNGVWTLEDLANNTPAANRAFREACTLNYNHFMDAVRAELEGRKE